MYGNNGRGQLLTFSLFWFVKDIMRHVGLDRQLVKEKKKISNRIGNHVSFGLIQNRYNVSIGLVQNRYNHHLIFK